MAEQEGGEQEGHDQLMHNVRLLEELRALPLEEVAARMDLLEASEAEAFAIIRFHSPMMRGDLMAERWLAFYRLRHPEAG